MAPRGRANTATRLNGKGKRRKKGGVASPEASGASAKSAAASGAGQTSWGIFEPFHGVLGPVITIAKPLWTTNAAVLVICFLLFMVFFRSPSPPPLLSHDIGCPGYTLPQRLAAYEEMWRREESELWSWLEDRVGMDGIAFPTTSKPLESRLRAKPTRKQQNARELAGILRENRMSDREMNHAIRTTRERLDTLEEMLYRQKVESTEPEEIQHEL